MDSFSAIVSRNVIGRRVPLWKLLLVGGGLLLAFLLPYRGDLIRLGILVGGAWLVVLSYYHPMPAVFALMVLSTNVFLFVDTIHLSHWQIAPGLRLTILDGLLAAMFGVAVVKLYQRREHPLFLKPMLLLAGVVVIPFIPGLLLGATNLDIGMSYFRIMFTYVFYFILIASVDSPRRLRVLIGMVFVILIISVASQIVEIALGHRLILGDVRGASNIRANSLVIVEDRFISYLWSRAPVYLYVGLFLALGASFSGKHSYRFLPIALLGLLGFIITMVRSWSLAVLVSILTLCALQRGQKFRTAMRIIAVFTGLLALITVIGLFSETAYSDSLMNTWIARMRTILHYEETTFAPKARIWQEQMGYLRQLPLFGYGMSAEYKSVWNVDTGFTNSLLQFGLIGLTAIVTLIASVLRKGYQLWRRLEPSLERGYVAAMLALWPGILLLYSFSWDFFTRQDGIWGVTLAMAILDRTWLLYSEK